MKKIIDIDDKTHLSLSIMALKLKTNLKNYIETILSTHAKNAIVEPHVVMQGCQCKDRIGETTVWCCNQCGLPCEDGWLPTHKAIRQPTVASSAVGSQTSARTCANGCDWPNCTLEGCVDPKCDC